MSTQDGNSTSSVDGWARGMVRVDLLTPTLEFLEILKQKGASIKEATVRSLVEELVYMNWIRFSTCMNRISFSTSSQSSIFDTDDPKSSFASHENLLSVGSKRTFPKDSELRALQTRWRRINGD